MAIPQTPATLLHDPQLRFRAPLLLDLLAIQFLGRTAKLCVPFLTFSHTEPCFTTLTSTSISISTSTVYINSSAVATPSAYIVPTVYITTSPNGSGRLPSPYTFLPGAQDNVAVYYGQSPDTKSGGLSTLCASPNVDIVILAFVNKFFHAGGYPAVNFGPACGPPNAAQEVKAPGLQNCPQLATEIKSCQKAGKPVLVSLGGWGASTSFSSDAQATAFAATLWNLFGAGHQTPHLRPFGTDVKIDGFDIDNENHSTDYYDTFATALRAQFAKDKSKKYYLSAAPQCPIPDASIPIGLMAQADFVWVQFYNNPSCNLNSTGFASSFEQWSKLLNDSSGEKQPRLYVGSGAFEAAGSGYVPGSELRGTVGRTDSHVVGSMGGIMLWDGSAALKNVDVHGRNYLEYAKAAVL
ncbi:hypothetical protein LTR62_007110 [Meristemomyces frigidus]|uniref:chitinase n=1 Tax=Meristemomyces frigidus TaxID=1508187 RepID=A0AAN7YMI7_9PEZI|nr:hypothetical protein LTR62_007110 [Meristemomyces frigidus]